MATLTLPLFPGESPIRLEPWAWAEPQGAEDKLLRENAFGAITQWEGRAEFLLGTVTAEDYVSVPFETLTKVRMTCKHMGPLKPMPYPLDE